MNYIVLLCNRLYLSRCIQTIINLRTIGKYNGPNDYILLIRGDDWNLDSIDKESANILSTNVKIIYFSDIDLSSITEQHNKYSYSSPWNNHTHKTFQWHKLYLFHSYFKQYEKILYIDVGMKIYKDIHPLFEIDCKNSLLAHSDAYPYKHGWTLEVQFEMNANKDCSTKLSKQYNLNVDYFQTTIMLFDTNIIKEDTFDNLKLLMNTYPISKTNEQAIMNLYFNCEEKVWKQIPFGKYDYMRRENYDYILTKI
jgi:hypothetical protein